MKRSLSIFIFLAILLTSCSLSKATPTVSSSDIATQVNLLLTAIPTATTSLMTASTATQPFAVVTATTAPTQVATTEPTQTTVPQPTATNALTATSLPSSTATVAPTATLAPTSTLPASDPTLKFGQPTFVEPFANGHNWPTGDNSFTAIEIKDGTLKLTALTAIDGWRLTWPIASNYYVEMSAKSDNCTGSDHFGLILRVPNIITADQGYFYGITCDGNYFLRKWDGKISTELIKLTADKNILTGPNQVNRLGILLSGSRLVPYINGVKLTEVNDNTYTKGAFGIFVGSKTTTKLNVIVNKISYWENP